MILRNATENDLQAINDIYNYYVLNSVCTSQEEPETLEDRLKWFKTLTTSSKLFPQGLPVIVAEINGRVCGWASASPFYPRSGCRFTVENSIYVDRNSFGRGIDRKSVV